MKKMVILCMTIVMMSSLFLTPVYAVEFSDLNSSHWAYEYITTLANDGVINGYTDGTYRPSGTVKRSEFIKLVISSCMPKSANINDVFTSMNHWAAGYVKVAETYGVITQGSVTIENIDQPITRLEMVKIISNADIKMKGNAQQFDKSTNFIDIASLQLADEFLLRHAVNRGLITGYKDGTFKPDKTMTRAEAATMIYRFTK